MTPELTFTLSSNLALAGWIMLVLRPFAKTWSDRIAGYGIPIVLSAVYLALIIIYWSQGEGGYNSLPDVMALFDTPGVALAGWVHFLAFDLAVGGWIAREAERRQIRHWYILPSLALTLWFGPIGLLSFFILSALLSTFKHRMQGG